LSDPSHRSGCVVAGPSVPYAPMTDSKPKVAALVLNYNGKDVTLQSLESVVRMTYSSYVVALVDNGSSDGSAEAVGVAFPRVEQVLVPVNEGPAAGVNAGLRWALDGGFDYALVLNNDIEVAPDMLDRMVEVAEADPRVGCVGPKAYYYEDRQRIWSAGGRLQYRESITRERGMRELDRGQFDRTERVDYVTGCAMLVKREVIEKVGLWDPTYFLSVEDADWCTRMKRHGYHSMYAHRAVLWHMVSATLGTYVPAKTFHNGRSTAIFVRRYANPWQWVTFFAWLSVAVPFAYLRELRHGNQAAAVAKLKGVWEGLRAPLTPPPAL
jgi:GT2 family glycosyltransferase